MKLIAILTLSLLSVPTFAKVPGKKVINKTIKCARTVLYNHQGTKDELVSVVETLNLVQVYLASNYEDTSEGIEEIEAGLAQCRDLKENRIKGYALQDILGLLSASSASMPEKLFILIDQDIPMKPQMRIIVRTLIEGRFTYRGVDSVRILRELIARDN